MNRVRWGLVVMIGIAAGVVWGEDLDVITLRDGRVFEGHYNDLTGVMRTIQGKVRAAITIVPEEIVSRSTKTVPDADDAPPAPEPAHPVKSGDAPDRAQRAQRVEDLVARQNLVQALTAATDEHRKLQTDIDQDEADRKDIPLAVKDDDQHIADAHDQVDRDIVREAQVTAANPGSQAETDARMQHDHDSAELAKFQAEEIALKKKLAAIDEELPGLRAQFKDSTARQAQAQAALAALDANAADDPLATLSGAGSATLAAPTQPAEK